MAIGGAEQLEEKFNALGEKFDLLKDVSKADKDRMMALLSDFQDWYWGNFEAWPSDELLHWQERYRQGEQHYQRMAAKTVTVSSYKETSDYHGPPQGPVQHMEPIYITARPPPPPPPPSAPIVVGPLDLSKWGDVTASAAKGYALDTSAPVWSQGAVLPEPSSKGLMIMAGVLVFGIVAYKNDWF